MALDVTNAYLVCTIFQLQPQRSQWAKTCTKSRSKFAYRCPRAKNSYRVARSTFASKKGKISAVYAQNHQGDKRVALWLNSPPAAQAAWVKPKTFAKSENADYFVLRCVGQRSWLGVRLDHDLAFSHVHDLVREA